jgi:hypothetical protein
VDSADLPRGGFSLPGFSVDIDTAGCCAAGVNRINQAVGLWNSTFDWLQWHHFVFLKNGPWKQIWIDGELFLEGDGTKPLPADFEQITFGGNHVYQNGINGMLDDIAVFGSGLTEAQIVALAAGTSPRSFDIDTDGDGMPD